MNLLKDLAPAVRKETKRMSIFTFSGVAVMWIAFAVLHACIPEKIPFDHTVILAGLIGGFIAALNFFLMGVTVQKVSAETNEDNARLRMKASYSRRTLLQMAWVIVAIAAPCFQFAAGILPLLFPSFGINLMGLIHKE